LVYDSYYHYRSNARAGMSLSGVRGARALYATVGRVQPEKQK
jgi:hypothetical protein